MNKEELEKRLINVNESLEKTKNLFNQLVGQKLLLENLIKDWQEKPSENA